MNTLQTVAKIGTRIRHKEIGTDGVIVGDYDGGFVVKPDETKSDLGHLPFDDVGSWEVIPTPTEPKFKATILNSSPRGSRVAKIHFPREDEQELIELLKKKGIKVKGTAQGEAIGVEVRECDY